MSITPYVVIAALAFAAPPAYAAADPGAVPPSAPTDGKYTEHRAKGIVEKLDPRAKRITVKHGPVPSLGWPSKTTTFAVLDGVSLAGIAPGNEVDFEFTSSPDGSYLVTTLSKSSTLDGRAELRGAARQAWH